MTNKYTYFAIYLLLLLSVRIKNIIYNKNSILSGEKE
jgi:hypothetical protein|tara:strand:- start:2198 stop:2308 length:111 start_codon:yes stop_codon:yes gene_type:complete